MDKGQAERLVPMLEEMLAEAGAGWGDVGRIGVCTGPGNFTGIRISVALARGLALGLGIPALGVTSFEAIAGNNHFPFWATLAAPRGQIYAQRFPNGSPVILDAGASFDAPVRRREAIVAEDFVASIAEIAGMKLAEGAPRPAPFYLRGADAAPPADPPPTLLPDPAAP